MSRKVAPEVEVTSLDANYVVLLTNAEKIAREKIEEARKRKMVKMKKARDMALVEVESFKIECETKLKKLTNTEECVKNKTSASVEQELSKKSSELKTYYEKNKKSTIQFIVNEVMDTQIVPHINLRQDIS